MYNKFFADASISKTTTNYKVKMTHDFGNNLELFAQAERINYKTLGIKSDSRADI